MNSFSFNRDEPTGSDWVLIWNTILTCKDYFHKYSGADYKESMHYALHHALTHYDPNKGEIFFYIIKLAKSIPKINTRDIPIMDRLDVYDYSLDVVQDIENKKKPRVEYVVEDFSTGLIESITNKEVVPNIMAKLVLENMEMFIKLCEALRTKDISYRSYSDVFKISCKKVSSLVDDFTGLCLEVYRRYGNQIQRFISRDVRDYGVWREADYRLIRNKESKRIVLTNKKGGILRDADTESFHIKGLLNNRIVFRVRYIDIYNHISKLMNSKVSNCVKFFINNRYIIRTPAGSQSLEGIPVENMEKVLLNEIITNIITDTHAMILNIGSECVYLLTDKNTECIVQDRCVRGIKIHMDMEVLS